jgi:Tol biopolymer transport system component
MGGDWPSCEAPAYRAAATCCWRSLTQTSASEATRDPAWTPRGDSIVFVDDYALWKLNPDRPYELERLPFPGIEALTPAFSRQGNRFAYQKLVQRYDIWDVDVSGPGG